VDLTNIGLEAASHYAKTPLPGSKLIQLPGPYYTWMGMNTQNPKLSDIRIRKAIQRAVDIDSILEGGYYGVAPKAYGVVPLGILGHRDSARYSYNPDEAKKLLAEAGATDLSLSLVVITSQPEQLAAAQIIQANLADIGVQVKIEPTDAGLFWSLGLESKGDRWKTLELWIMRYACLPDPSDAITWFRKDQIGIWNWERWSSPEFEALWTQGIAESDSAKRAAIYVRMQEIMEDTGAYVWLTFDPLYNIGISKVEAVFDPLGAMQPELFKA
jgi:peptide/nickel transport system substrate-binding protein